jgi:NAD(P)-dependent dehydrogenase (short-subunit alcohol dehydrogenase family)
MPSYLITGASRGLGYGFLQSLSRDPSNTIIGLVRNISATRAKLSADGLTNVHLVEADITDSAALARAAKEAEKFLGGKGLDVLVNNAAWISTETQYSTFAE